MAKSVFFSFDYGNDAWRVQQVMNMGALEGQTILNAQAWEAVKQKGDAAIKTWIADQMAYKRAVVVLIGSRTANRHWVNYEIAKAWDERKPLVGVRIHGLANSLGYSDPSGANPFAGVPLQNGGTVADYVPVFTPSGATSKLVHSSIAANIGSWVDNAYKRS